jgi:Zn ribbon nucleic-acid-binding protein
VKGPTSSARPGLGHGFHRDAFAHLRRQYETALAEERAFDARDMPAPFFTSEEVALESDRLAEIRCGIEDALMACPSPDASAFAFKYLVARGDGRDTDCWNDMLQDEARRFAAWPMDPRNLDGDAFAGALAEYEGLRAAELAIPGCENLEEEEAQAGKREAAWDAAQKAFDRMIVMPVSEGVQAAAKLRAVNDFYRLASCGLDEGVLAQVLAEIDAALTGQRQDKAIIDPVAGAWHHLRARFIAGDQASTPASARADALLAHTEASAYVRRCVSIAGYRTDNGWMVLEART